MNCIRFKIIFNKELRILLPKTGIKAESMLDFILNKEMLGISTENNHIKNKIDISICTTDDLYYITDNNEEYHLCIEDIKKQYNILDYIAYYNKK